MSERARFDRDTLAWLRNAREVRIETHGPDGTAHRAIIWTVVDSRNRVLVRSYRGSGARWYREATSGREVRLAGDGRSITVRPERAVDAERVAACSAEYERTYAGDPATAAMVRDEILDTTLELHPS